MQSARSFVLIGASYRTASLETREQLAAVLPMLSRAVGETIVLSTCNRVEIYAAAPDAEAARSTIVQLLASLLGHSYEKVRPCLYILEGQDVVRHLMRVAAGLDSIVLGETQILGQVTRAFTEATASGTADPFLCRLFTSAIRAGKRAHSETGISRFPTSVSHVAVALLEHKLGNLGGKK